MMLAYEEPSRKQGPHWMTDNMKLSSNNGGPAVPLSFSQNATKVTAKQDAKRRTIEWLKSELEKRPGYAEFRAGFYHVKHNPDVVQSWRFAVEFVEAYNKQMLIVRVLSSHLDL
jgi:hypothetical protein